VITEMSQAKTTFDDAIRDAEELLAHFDKANTKPPPENAEVLKRAGLIMAFTAWETYVEDRVAEALNGRIGSEGNSPSARFVKKRLDEELKKFNNPNTEKTRRLFLDFLEVDVTKSWVWNQYDCPKVKSTLDDLIVKRGEAVHRSKAPRNGTPAPHLVTREDLKRAISFLKSLVAATEKAL
jgi:hypothetical protein